MRYALQVVELPKPGECQYACPEWLVVYNTYTKCDQTGAEPVICIVNQ